MKRPYDIVVFGATGFTGQLVVEYFDQKNIQDINWAIAGRNQTKLNKIQSHCKNHQPDIILADAFDQKALNHMSKSTHVVINVCLLYTSPSPRD